LIDIVVEASSISEILTGLNIPLRYRATNKNTIKKPNMLPIMDANSPRKADIEKNKRIKGIDIIGDINRRKRKFVYNDSLAGWF